MSSSFPGCGRLTPGMSVFRRNARFVPARAGDAPTIERASSPMTASPDFVLSLPARPEMMTVIRHVLGGVAESWPVSAEALVDLQIAVTEACVPATEDLVPDRAPGTIDVHGWTEDGRVVILVLDRGDGAGATAEPSGEELGDGLGLALIEALTESTEVRTTEDGRRELRMVFPPEPGR